jgi:hypothetical protein
MVSVDVCSCLAGSKQQAICPYLKVTKYKNPAMFQLRGVNCRICKVLIGLDTMIQSRTLERQYNMNVRLQTKGDLSLRTTELVADNRKTRLYGMSDGCSTSFIE